MTDHISQQELKKKRLAEQLRQNLRKRKTQNRATRNGKADQTSGLPAAHGGSNNEILDGNQPD